MIYHVLSLLLLLFFFLCAFCRFLMIPLLLLLLLFLLVVCVKERKKAQRAISKYIGQTERTVGFAILWMKTSPAEFCPFDVRFCRHGKKAICIDKKLLLPSG